MAPVEVVAPKAVHRAQDGVDLRAGEQFAGRSGSRRREQASAAVFRQPCYPVEAWGVARHSRRRLRKWPGNYEKLASSGCPSVWMKTTLDKPYSPCSEGYSRV